MSDLIDFNSSGENVVSLASPLIPAPDIPNCSGPESGEAGNQLADSGKRCSFENNPFDQVMKQVTDYERNKEDPFERVIEKAKGFARPPAVLKINKTMDKGHLSTVQKHEPGHKDNHISIVNELNDTKLTDNEVHGEQTVESWSCDKDNIPRISVCPSTDLSILDTSDMNDSLIDSNRSLKTVQSQLFTCNPRLSISQCNLFSSPVKLQGSLRRSLSVTDAFQKTSPGEQTSLTVQSSLFDDPMNNAFRRGSNVSNESSNLSSFNSHFLTPVHNRAPKRLDSDSSVFSGLSNISAIPIDPVNKFKHDRLNSESSTCSGISNISMIPAFDGSCSLSCDSSVFLNDTNNKAFITSGSVSVGKSPFPTAKKSELIKKFNEIKTRMSTSDLRLPKEQDQQVPNKNPIEDSFMRNNHSDVQLTSVKDPEEKLIDIDATPNNSTSDVKVGVNELISQEAKALFRSIEERFDENEDDSISKIQLNFDELPPSDDESVDNLIDLPVSPFKSPLSELNKDEQTNIKPDEDKPRNDIKELENEFIESKNCNKKAMAATLLLDLQKIIKDENNPDANKVLNDLQKLLGVDCNSNTEILEMYLQNNASSDEQKTEDKLNSEEKIPNNIDKPSEYIQDMHDSSPNDSNPREVSNEENSENDSGLAMANDSKEELSEGVKQKNKPVNTTFTKNKESVSRSSEDETLAQNLLSTLNQILNGNNKDIAVNVLKNLGTVLNATNRSSGNAESVTSERKSSRKLSHSTNSLVKSPSVQRRDITQNKSFELLPTRRSVSTNRIYRSSSNLLAVPSLKDKRRSDFLATKKRFPSDPGLLIPVSERKITSPSKIKSQSSLGRGQTTLDPVITKLKTKPATMNSKKGPLKAVIPLGSMQKRASVSQRMSVHNETRTPPKQDSAPKLKMASSTPNSEGEKNCKKPAASSTPNSDTLQRTKIQEQNSKNNLGCSTSPVSTKISPRKLNAIKTTGKRMERTLSPQKKPPTPRKDSPARCDSKLPKYSPRPVRVRNSSFNDLRIANCPPSPIGRKVSSEKKIQRHLSVLSPLKNLNKLPTRGSSMNLASRLKPGVIPTGPEKENYM